MNNYQLFSDAIATMRQSGLYNNIKIIGSGQGGQLKIDGKQYLNLCSNNYLGLACDKRLVQATTQAVKKYGVGTGSTRPLSGTNKLHIELETRLAKLKHAEAAIVLSGGYMANLAAVQTIVSKEDIVISDELNHASIIDAVRLAQVGNKLIYRHKNMADLKKQLIKACQLAKKKKTDGTKPIILIITDGVFSMDGDMAPLPEIVKLAKKYNALTMVDDAHGEGVLGNHGRGIVDHFKLHGQVDIEVGTLSKAFGVLGGFISGKKDLIDYYRQKARQFLFSNGLSVPDTAALIESVKILEGSDGLVKKLWSNAKYLKKELVELGFDCGASETPIIPLMLGKEETAKKFSQLLFEENIYATAIKFPMVALGKARIRIMPSASHTKKDYDQAIKVFAKIGKELKII